VPAGLLEHSGTVVTPHIGFSSDVSLADLRRGAAEEVVRVLPGEPPRHPRNSPAASSTAARNEVTA
jgi:D-3-phosphoglycerate dehydrogenase